MNVVHLKDWRPRGPRVAQPIRARQQSRPEAAYLRLVFDRDAIEANAAAADAGKARSPAPVLRPQGSAAAAPMLPPVLPPCTTLHSGLAAADERRRLLQNVVAMAVVAVVVLFGSWAFTQLQAAARFEACFDQGRRACLPLNASTIADVR